MKNTLYVKHEVPESYIEKWQHTVNLMARIFDVPTGLIMRVLPEEIEVLVSSKTENNPYEPNEKANLDTGLYCETVISTRSQLCIDNALEDEEWKNNPDVKLNMIFYLGVPLVWPNGNIFGTICILDDKTRSFSRVYHDLLWQFKEVIEADFQLIVQAEKLEEHQRQLENLVEERTTSLKQEITERKQAEEKLQKISYDLAERVKELNCLYGISKLVENHNTTLEAILQGIADLIPLSWQYPEITCAQITLYGQSYKSDNFEETEWLQSKEVIVSGEKYGSVEVCFLEEKPAIDEGPFLKEERSLINAIGERLGHFIEKKEADLKLKESEESYHSIVENIPGITYRAALDKDWTVFIMNEYVELLTGYPPSDFINSAVRSFGSIIHREDTENVSQSVNEAIEKRGHWGIDYRIYHKDGSMRWFHEKGRGVFDENGNLKFLEGIIVDITTRKQTEDALRESKKINQSIIDCSKDCIKILDENGCLLFMSKGGQEMMEIDNIDSFLHQSWIDFWQEDEYEMAWAAVQQAAFGETASFQGYCPTSKGTPKYWDIIISPLFDSQHNEQPKQLLAISRDITDWKKAVDEVQESKKLFSLFMENLPGVAFIKEPGGPQLFANKGYCKILGKTQAELIGITDDLLFSAEISNRFIEQDRSIISKGRSKQFDEIIPDTHGPRSWLTTKFPIYREGKTTLVGGVAFDITERKQAEEEKEKLESQLRQAVKMQAVGTLAGGIAHEFNNLIGIIMGSTEVALDAVSNDNYAKRQLDRVIKASLNAKGLVKQILTFSRKSDHNPFPLSPYPVVKEALKLMGGSIPSSVEIHKNLSTDCTNILVDPTEIQQILMNICFNAVHAMKEKGVLEISLESIRLSTKEAKICNLSAGQYARLSVRDTGEGMDAGTRERVFEPFFTTKAVGQGTGMGLALVYGIMERYGGAVTCESEIGEGTTFHLYFPETEKILPEKVGELGQLPLGTEHILLVDDEEMFAEMGRDMLESLGYCVTMMTDSSDALKFFQEQPDKFDLVITDQVMPEVSGEELCRGILNIKPQMPIILCTGFSTQMDEKKAKRIGIREYAMKPLQRSETARLIRKVLDASR